MCRQRGGVVPREPFFGLAAHLCRVLQHRGEILDWVDAVQAAGVDQAHEQVTDPGAVHRFVEQGVLAVANRRFQGPFTNVVVQRRPGHPQEGGQRLPMPEHVLHGLAQAAVGLHQVIVELAVEHSWSSSIKGPLLTW